MQQSEPTFDKKRELQNSLKVIDIKKKNLEIEGKTILSELNAVPLEGGAPIGVDTPLVDSEGYPRNDIDIYRAKELRSRFHEIVTDRKYFMFKLDEGLKKLALLNNLNNKEKEIAELKARTAIKPKPKFDPITGKWVLSNWDGTIAGVENGHKRSFDNVPSNISNMHIAYPSLTPLISSSSTLASKANSENEHIANNSDPIYLKHIPFAIVDLISLDSPASTAGLKTGDLIVKFGTAHHSNDRFLKKMTELVSLEASEGKHVPIMLLRLNNCGSGRIPLSVNIFPRPWQGRGLLGCHISPYSGFHL